MKCFLSFVSPAIKEKYTDWTEFLIRDLTGSRTAPANLLEGVCIIVYSYSMSEASQLHELKPIGTFAYILPQVHAYTQVSICKELNFLFFPKLLRLLILMALKNLHLCYSKKWGICFYVNTFLNNTMLEQASILY